MAPESQEQTPIHGLRDLISKTAHKTAVMSSLVAALFAAPASLAHASEMSDINKLMRAGQYAEALTKTDAVLAKHPRDAQLRFTKGLILAEQNRSAEAIAVFTKLTEDFPDLPEPYNNLAVLYAADGQYDKARAALDMAMRTNPTYATALENLGDVYAKLASQAYDKALQIDPGANVPQPKLTLLRSLNGNTTGGTVPRLASAAAAQREAKAKAEASAAEQQQRAKALAAEKLAQQAAADKAEAEKNAISKATSEKEKAAADKAAAEKAAADKAAADKAAADKAAAEKAAADKAAADKAAADKAAAEKAAADKAAAEKARAEKARAEQLAAEQARAQKAAAEKAAAEQKQKELLAQKDKEQAEKLAREQAARAEKEKAAQAAADKAKADKLAAAEKAKADKLAAAEKAKADKARADKEKAKEQASAEQDKTAVLAALNGWAKAWSDKDVRGYLGHYASDFDTPKGASRKEWAEERRARIEDKGRISVKVSNATVSINGNTATVRYRQIYNSDRLTVDSRKTLIFVKQGNRWLIKQERSGG
ncbi:tetratricopeptide repeat protein [Herbaspirillum seropedicae]|uniref:nuclear transport factor 2 family protein n=1 Tax=Herbaspirillum seropedicae TaxID=964 RepID=UPI001F0FB6A9|nr:nuclear transport factor 2 family protein [Herbaspirillum seropedicae]UMU21382.1 tetratricopeptide repeat protein [Herbaspirillum seropedicae]